jgi:carbon monoxide dehydrogenase subunit G
MELSNTRVIPAPPSAVWAALNDAATLKACLPGCESLERSGDRAFDAVMSVRIGPVSARFTGRMTMTDIDAPTAYTLQFEGQGGAAGFARGEARVTLVPEGAAQTSMTYTAKAQVGGKLAQIGSRLVDGAAAKITDDFFARFVAHVGAPEPVAATPDATIPAGTPSNEDAAQPLAPPGGSPWIRYAAIVAIVVVLIVLYAHGHR